MSHEAMPDRVELQLATVAASPPEGEGWIHEIKLDGYRLSCRLESNRYRFFTRGGHDWTSRLHDLASSRLPARDAWLDGELVVERADGTTDFQALQNDLGEGRTERLRYYVFDLLWLDGRDIRREKQLHRKELLSNLIEGASDPGRFRYCDHILGHGADVFRSACRLALEGTISKRVDAGYFAGRGSMWLKNRCVARDEVLIGGYTKPSGGRTGLGALLLGARENGKLRYLGRVGTGFSEKTLQALHERLRSLERKESPFSEPLPPASARARFVEPLLVATVTYTGWTQDRRLRHPSFGGLREDIDPAEVRLEPGPVEEMVNLEPSEKRNRASQPRVTNPDRLVFVREGISKQELATYYARVADWILPHIRNRLLTLVRCPGGVETCFYQKHVQEGMPREIHALSPVDKTGRPRLFVDSPEGLVALIQMGAVEIHPGGSRIDRLDRPDRLVIDLDPGPETSWEQVVEAALLVREILGQAGLIGFPRTTGGMGLHVVVPLERRSTWPQARAYAKAVSEQVAARDPSRFTARQAKAGRTGRIYLDWLRNARGATAVASYSVRARDGAPVATPLYWSELLEVRPERFDTRSIWKRLNLVRDPWEEFFEVRQSITKRAMASVGLS